VPSMLSIDFDYAELEQLSDGFVRASSLTKRGMVKANVEIMKQGIKIAKSLAPKDEFKLTNNIRLISQVTESGGVMGTDLVYSWMKEEGGVIRAKRAKWLVFQARDGRWVRTKQVTQVGHFFMRDAYEQMEAIAEREYNKLVDQMVTQIFTG
jgi:hypothetical protein